MKRIVWITESGHGVLPQRPEAGWCPALCGHTLCPQPRLPPPPPVPQQAPEGSTTMSHSLWGQRVVQPEACGQHVATQIICSTSVRKPQHSTEETVHQNFLPQVCWARWLPLIGTRPLSSAMHTPWRIVFKDRWAVTKGNSYKHKFKRPDSPCLLSFPQHWGWMRTHRHILLLLGLLTVPSKNMPSSAPP